MNPAPSLHTLPALIDAPGYYRTRAGDKVLVSRVATSTGFKCTGCYSSGRQEAWDRSGRLYFGIESPNDIVSKI